MADLKYLDRGPGARRKVAIKVRIADPQAADRRAIGNLASGDNLLNVLLGPVANRGERLAQGAAERGELVLDTRRTSG